MACDATGRGLEDLRDGILRTPLPPQETFKDGERGSEMGAL
jgi:tRNA nucleotidyltransferase/poly(A) polymerase